MKLIHYKQIRVAFHPDDQQSSNNNKDKCYPLRYAINTFNQASENVKFMGENLTFDEGGIGSQHQLNPVQKKNLSTFSSWLVAEPISSIILMSIKERIIPMSISTDPFAAYLQHRRLS
jgi:hypothetical protein